MSEAQTVQWFPGHMTRTRRQMEKSLKLVDAVAEVADARIPVSSRNPELDRILKNKPRILLLNKCDMADPAQTARWLAWYRSQGWAALAVDCKTGKGLGGFQAGGVADLPSDDLAGRAAYHKNISRLQAGPLQKFGNGLFGLTGDLLIHDKDLLGDKIPNHIFPQYTTKSEKCIRPWGKRKSGR